MNERGAQLQATANGQIAELVGLLSTRGEGALRLPCPGREKLGDGTVAACALHTADSYHRIAGFLHGHGEGKHHDGYRVERTHLRTLLDRLSRGRAALRDLAELTDERLDSVPPASDMKFCDGQRTLEQVVSNLLNHQGHQLDAVRAALA